MRNNLVIGVPTKRDNIAAAGLLADLYATDDEVREILDANRNSDLIGPRLQSLEPTMRKALLSQLLPIGIAFHDADLTVAERQLVGDAFREGEIAVLICTSTMAQGINLPAQSIAFLGWGLGGNHESGSEPYYKLLETEIIPWLGRVGRYGRHAAHRPARALYIASRGPGSDEYESIRRLLDAQRAQFETMLHNAATLEEPLLFVLSTMRVTLGRAPTFAEIEAWFYSTPSGRAEHVRAGLSVRAYKALVKLGRFKRHPLLVTAEGHLSSDPAIAQDWCAEYVARFMELQQVLPVTADYARGRIESLLITARGAADPPLLIDMAKELLEEPGVRALLLVPGKADPATLEIVDHNGENAFEVTKLGRIAAANGVQIETARILYRWLIKTGKDADVWDVLDILALLRSTPDGAAIKSFRIRKSHYERVSALYMAYVQAARERLGPDWETRSLLLQYPAQGVYTMATMLAMGDWRQGRPIYAETDGDQLAEDIEIRYGLRQYGCALYDMARSFARLLRVLGSIANSLPQDTFPTLRPEAAPRLEDGALCIPWDLEDFAGEILYGLPRAATSLAKIGVEGLARAWVMSLYEAVEAEKFEPDLPLLERARLFADDIQSFRAALPTPGLATRVIENLTAKGRLPLAESVRSWSLVEGFYRNPFIAAAHVAQGKFRYTALRMRHQRVYSIFRRNVTKGLPIQLENPEDLKNWVQRGSVEILAEIGRSGRDSYEVDAIFVDMDARQGYSLDALKRLAAEIMRRFAAHEWVDRRQVFLYWTGGKGFHIVAYFRESIFRPLDLVDRATRTILARLCDDVSIFLTDQPVLYTPYVVLDLSPVKDRGVHRNAFSLHAGTGNVCVPVEYARLKEFDPEREATVEAVTEILAGEVEVPDVCYPELVRRWFHLVRSWMNARETGSIAEGGSI